MPNPMAADFTTGLPKVQGTALLKIESITGNILEKDGVVTGKIANIVFSVDSSETPEIAKLKGKRLSNYQVWLTSQNNPDFDWSRIMSLAYCALGIKPGTKGDEEFRANHADKDWNIPDTDAEFKLGSKEGGWGSAWREFVVGKIVDARLSTRARAKDPLETDQQFAISPVSSEAI